MKASTTVYNKIMATFAVFVSLIVLAFFAAELPRASNTLVVSLVLLCGSTAVVTFLFGLREVALDITPPNGKWTAKSKH